MRCLIERNGRFEKEERTMMEKNRARKLRRKIYAELEGGEGLTPLCPVLLTAAVLCVLIAGALFL